MAHSTTAPRLSLAPFSPDRDLPLLDRWLAEPEVAAWFVDAAHERAEAVARPAQQQSILSVDGCPMGYARWQAVDPAALALLGLPDIRAGAVDLDVLLGEPMARGRGWGARFAQLLCQRLLADSTVSMIGMVTSVRNVRARRAWEKAGLGLEHAYDDARYGACHVFTRRRSDIAPATTKDEREVVALLTAQFAEHDISLETRQLEDTVSAIVSDPSKGLIVLARQRGALVAVMCLARTFTVEHGGEVWWIDELYVAPPWRNRGIGYELVQFAIGRAISAGAHALELEVEEAHARAVRLYFRAGFRRLSRQRWVRVLRGSAIGPFNRG